MYLFVCISYNGIKFECLHTVVPVPVDCLVPVPRTVLRPTILFTFGVSSFFLPKDKGCEAPTSKLGFLAFIFRILPATSLDLSSSKEIKVNHNSQVGDHPLSIYDKNQTLHFKLI